MQFTLVLQLYTSEPQRSVFLPEGAVIYDHRVLLAAGSSVGATRSMS